MPNDAKLGMVIGLALVLLVAIVFAGRQPASAPPGPAPAAAVSQPPSATPVARTSEPVPAVPELFPSK